jgi:2-hydroxychromene-2-carboxylate isomerase
MQPPTNGRNSRTVTANREQTRASLQQKFKVHFPDQTKKVARQVGLSPETVDVYKQANVPQAWAQFAEVCKANPAFALDVLEDLGISIDQDRNAYTLFLQLQKTVRGQ